MLLADGAARLKFGSAAASRPYHLERRRRRTRKRRGSAFRKTWRAMLRRRPLLRRSRLCIPQRRRCAPEAWDDTEVIPPIWNEGGAPCECGAAAPLEKLGGRCFALLAPRSLRPSGHLRCASSTPPSVSVVGAHVCGEAAFASSRDGAARLRLGTTRRSSLQLERRGASNAGAGAAAPYPTLGYKPSSGMSCSIRSTGAGWS